MKDFRNLIVWQEGAFIDPSFLSSYRRISEGRNLWIDDPDT
jgi:hypothetical protein